MLLKLKNTWLFGLFLATALLGACNSGSTSQVPVTSPIKNMHSDSQLISSKVGIKAGDGKGACEGIIETQTIPQSTGQVYGWCIQLKTSQTKVRWREVFTTPSSPGSWGTLAKTQTLSADKRTSYYNGISELGADKTFFHLWEVSADDPPGHYTFSISVDGIAEPITLAFDMKPVPRIAPKTSQQPMGKIDMLLNDIDTGQVIGKEKYHLVFNDDPAIEYRGMTDDSGLLRLDAPVGRYTLNLENAAFLDNDIQIESVDQ